MAKPRRRKADAVAEEASEAPTATAPAPPTGGGLVNARPRSSAAAPASDRPVPSGRFSALASTVTYEDDDDEEEEEPEPAPALAPAAATASSSTFARPAAANGAAAEPSRRAGETPTVIENAPAGARRRRRGAAAAAAEAGAEGGAKVDESDTRGKERERVAPPPAPPAAAAAGANGTAHETTTGSSSSKSAAAPQGKTVPRRHTGGAAADAAAAADGGSGGGGGGRSVRGRRRLWRVLQWPLAVTAVLLALAAVNRRLIEEGPLTFPELLQEGLLGRLNVSLTLPPLALPRPSFDALVASTGFNVSSLVGLTDTLTDTLNDLTDTLSGARLTVTVRGLLAQLPAFGLPGAVQLGPVDGVNGSAAGGEGSGLRPGQLMARRGYHAKHPVVIVPGFVTSGLELWQGLPCGQRYFRQRMWGTLAMVQAFMTDPACWFRHMELDPETGLDPAGIKLRAAVGLEAVDYFIQGYWVWGKLVEALADVGYDSNSLVSMPYDWRLAMPLLEERDGYFTRLRLAVEALAEVNGERVVITAHSYGENVVRAFMSWIEAERPGWVEAHVGALINIAGTSLGVPKAVSALLSGETRDTAQLGALSGFLTSNLVPRATRTRVWRTWGASYAMLPVGGPGVWGNTSWAPDDTPGMRAEKRTYGAMVSLWPHNWQTVMAAAASAAPEQREELHRLVHNVSESAEEEAGPTGGREEPPAAEAAAAAAAAAAHASLKGGADGHDGGAGNGSAKGSSHPDGSSGGGGSAASPMSRITDTLKRLVSSGGSEVDPADYLDSEHVTRLDVGGFLSLLREVGGPLVSAHMREWAAVDLSTWRQQQQQQQQEEEEQEAKDKGGEAARRATSAADGDTPQARQALGGARRLRESVRRRVALFPDATRTPLPHAPTTSIVCLYGIGLPTERGYHYLRPPPPSTAAASAASPGAGGSGSGGSGDDTASRADPESEAAAAVGAVDGSGGGEEGGGSSDRTMSSSSSSPPPPPPPHNTSASGEESSPEAGSDASAGWMILTDVSDPGSKLDVGVQMSDGDGTVPLLSLGLMCRRGWRPGGRLNPGGSRVVTREFRHRSVSLLQDARGGPATAAHIDILGNEGVLADVIRVAAGRLEELDDVIHSDIDRIAAAVQSLD